MLVYVLFCPKTGRSAASGATEYPIVQQFDVSMDVHLPPCPLVNGGTPV